MFSISLEEDIYPRYRLSDDNYGSSIAVVPDRGGIVISWQVGGRELLYLDRDRYQDPSLTVRGGIPILFPICGNLPDNTYRWGDGSYQLKQHGFARDLPWQVARQDTQAGASLTLMLESNDSTRAVYPFDFTVSFTYTLCGGELIIAQEYTNHSFQPMPFATGLHPYFAISDKGGLKLDIPSDRYRDWRSGEIRSYDGTFDFSTPEIDVGFIDLASQTATAIDTADGVKLSLTASEDYRHFVFWTLADRGFYCLEPWTAPRNALNTGEDLLHLAPGAVWKTEVKLTKC
jgi:galactose mutarotase-like enzyme